MPLSAVVSVLCGVVVAVLIGTLARNKAANPSPRNRAIWSLVMWSVVVVLGLAIWIVARGRISN